MGAVHPLYPKPISMLFLYSQREMLKPLGRILSWISNIVYWEVYSCIGVGQEDSHELWVGVNKFEEFFDRVYPLERRVLVEIAAEFC